MKKFIILFFAISLTVYSIAQEGMQINMNLLQNGNQLVIDSVLVENISASGDTMLYYPVSVLDLGVYLSIEDIFSADGTSLLVSETYPNPFDRFTRIDLYNPEETVWITIHDISGKQLFENSYNTGKGPQSFIFHPGNASQYLMKINAGNQTKTLSLIHSGNTNSTLSLEQIGAANTIRTKTTRTSDFSYQRGDELRFTAYTTACQTVENDIITISPSNSTSIDFDFTHLTDLQPERPVVDEITADENSITWTWNPSSLANGYKINLSNDYSSATDIGLTTEYAIESLPAGTNYNLYVWAYNDCGESEVLRSHQATTAIPFNTDENQLILEAESTVALEIMNIFEQPDSVILRTPSTNILTDEENLQHLIDRMKKTVTTSSGVGLAAPQIGLNRRVIWVQRWDKGMVIHPWEVYYNPRIVNYSDTVVYKSDGCLSVPSGGEYPEIEGFSYRAIWVDVEYINEVGELIIERINHQYTAHIFQHEIDHLNAVMFFDRQVEEDKSKFTVIEGESYENYPPID
jgi:peptide deformylase